MQHLNREDPCSPDGSAFHAHRLVPAPNQRFGADDAISGLFSRSKPQIVVEIAQYRCELAASSHA